MWLGEQITEEDRSRASLIITAGIIAAIPAARNLYQSMELDKSIC